VNVDTGSGTGNAVGTNITFNDLVDNTEGLEVRTAQTNNINATYNWWGDGSSSRIVGQYNAQNIGVANQSPPRVYKYVQIHMVRGNE
jgi:hypothetical protein